MRLSEVKSTLKVKTENHSQKNACSIISSVVRQKENSNPVLSRYVELKENSQLLVGTYTFVFVCVCRSICARVY